VQKESWVLPGHLYMVATPIGNLADMTVRGQAVLADVDVIAAEDTRHTGQLLAALGIRKPMISVHDHNEQQRASSVVEQLLSGKSVAYVSDAGTPAISDPGALLAAAAAQAGVVVTPIPGASSVLAAISASGLDVRNGFVFAGFLPTGNKDRHAVLDVMAQESRVTVFFEAPHRIMATLELLAERWPSRQVVLAKELTKVFERFIRGTSLEVLRMMQANTDWHRGEFVLLLDKAAAVEEDAQALRMEQVLLPLLAELPLSQAVKLTCAITGQKKKPIYDLALSLQGDNSVSAC
jgi:16S rRNA (cytidine1402-2'-O)-methyltransferase